MVRRNLIRGGRGVVLEEQVDELVRLERPADGERATREQFMDTLAQTFSPAAMTRIGRAAELLSMALSGDLTLLDATGDDAESAVAGQLSVGEMRTLLPYLLSQEGVTDEPRFWRHLGDMIDLKALETMTSSLSGLDLSRLVVPNLHTWRGRRAAVAGWTAELEEVAQPALADQPSELSDGQFQAIDGAAGDEPAPDTSIATAEISPSSEHPPEPEPEPEPELDPSGRWMIHARMLSTVIGTQRVHVTATGQKLKVHDGRMARWSDVRSTLEAYGPSAIDLDGIERQIRLTSSQVTSDVAALSESIEDDYRIGRVTLRSQSVPESSVHVKFSDSIVEAEPEASLHELVDAASTLLGYRLQGNDEHRAAALGPGTDAGEILDRSGPEADSESAEQQEG